MPRTSRTSSCLSTCHLSVLTKWTSTSAPQFNIESVAATLYLLLGVNIVLLHLPELYILSLYCKVWNFFLIFVNYQTINNYEKYWHQSLFLKRKTLKKITWTQELKKKKSLLVREGSATSQKTGLLIFIWLVWTCSSSGHHFSRMFCYLLWACQRLLLTTPFPDINTKIKKKNSSRGPGRIITDYKQTKLDYLFLPTVVISCYCSERCYKTKKNNLCNHLLLYLQHPHSVSLQRGGSESCGGIANALIHMLTQLFCFLETTNQNKLWD